ncbi:MAG: ComEC/Rec2 family competence protein [Chloracidobacterium sp.]|nr:ComEC/Rec2 family competence protein [Chloracidobacterium sp.]
MPEDRPRQNFNRHPMLLLAANFALGILIGNFVPLTETSLPALLVVALAALAFTFHKYNFSTICIALAFVATGFVSFQYEVKRNSSPTRIRVLYDNAMIRSGDPVEVEGVLLGRPEPSIDGVFLNLRAEKVTHHSKEFHVSGNVRLFLPVKDSEAQANFKFEISDLKYGSRIRVACKLDREDEYLNPGVMRKRDILDRLGVDATGSIKSHLLVEKLADESIFIPLAWVYDRRAQLISDFKNNLGPSSAGVMIASLLGDKYFLDRYTADLFRDGGTFHILVISGLHITFIGGLLILFLRQCTRNRWFQFIVTTLVLWVYTLAVGADVPVVRATIMFTVVSFSYVIFRQGNLLNSLGVCAFILLVWRPSELFNPSFQLTFVSVAAIIGSAYPLLDKLQKIGKWRPSTQTPFPPNVPNRLKQFCELLYWSPNNWKVEAKRNVWTASFMKSLFRVKLAADGVQTTIRFVFEAILVSLIVQIWMLPLLVVYFHRVSVASVLLNLWVGFFIAIESFAAVIGAVAGNLSSLLAAPFFWLAEVANWLMLLLPRVFSDLGRASFRLPAYSGAGRAVYALYFLPILFLVIVVNRWLPFGLKQESRFLKKQILLPMFSILILFAGIIIFHPFSAPRPDGRLHLDFLDVGQGDSVLVTFPDGKTLLIDGGGRFSFRKKENDDEDLFEPDVRTIGEAVVSEFLWDRGLSRIDHILATHADVDHIQGLTDVARNFKIGSAVFGRTPMNDPDFSALAEVLQRRNIPVETIARGERLEFGGVTIEVLYPTETDDPDAVSNNDHSVVLRIIYGSRAFLLTGDIERKAEAALLNNGGTLTADMIKVAHHGSRTSSTQEFVDAVGATFAVISVGRNSPFGHPHPEVADRWRESGATVMTTGERGTISVSTDGRDLEITSFVE